MSKGRLAYLQQRANRWYAVMDVPADVRSRLKKAKFVQSLKTESLSEAQRRVGPVVAHWKQLVSRSRGGEGIVTEGLLWRDMLSKANSADERDVLSGLLASRCDEIWQSGVSGDDLTLPPAELRDLSAKTHDAEKLYNIATGRHTPILEYGDLWSCERTCSQKTIDMGRSDLALLSRHFDSIESVDRKAASGFIRDVLLEDRKPATVNRTISSFRGYWHWLSDRGYLPENHSNPWNRQRVPTKGSETIRRGYTEREAAEFFRVVKDNAQRWPEDYWLVCVVALTGMRIDEAADLRPADLHIQSDELAWIRIPDAKTPNGKRRVPITEAATVRALKDRCHNSDYIFATLTPDRYGNRSQALSKRLARRLDKITTNRELVGGHGWRNRASTLLERADVHAWTADWFIGHKRSGERLGRYSDGPSDEQLLKAAKAMSLPAI